MRMKKEVTTLKKIAESLNISISTVSRALNDHQDISSQTKEKVKKLAKEMNYIPNLFAKGFRQHRSNIIGVVVSNVTHHYTTTIIRGILEEAAARVIGWIISESNNDS